MIDPKVPSAAAALALLAGVHAAAATAIPYAPVLGAQPEYREIKDWVLACDNTRACFAKYVAADDGAGGGGYLSIEREAGPTGALEVTIVGDQDASPALPGPGGPLLDGKPLGAFAWTRDAKTESLTLRGAAAERFIRAIGDGARLAYGPGKGAPYVSLSGMKAALLAMDDDQGRLGGVTALARPGPKPASTVPPATPAPVIYARPTPDNLPNSAAFAAAVRKAEARVLKAHDCYAEQAAQDQAHALDGANAIVILGCMEAAYQGTVLVFEAPRDAPAKAHQLFMPLEPRLDPGDSTNSDGEYTEGDWDPKSAAFGQSAKGRGIADCGSSSTWTWTGQAFQLSDYDALVRCGGGPVAGEWPTIYRTRVINR